jgi:hypothetical protein
MRPDQARAARLRRLERVRMVARQTAAIETAAAEAAFVQLDRLAERSRGMSADCPGSAATSGYDLAQSSRFAAGLQELAASTASEAARARGLADEKQQDLAKAERRRAAAAEQAGAAERRLAARLAVPVLSGRRAVGTGLE